MKTCMYLAFDDQISSEVEKQLLIEIPSLDADRQSLN